MQGRGCWQDTQTQGKQGQIFRLADLSFDALEQVCRAGLVIVPVAKLPPDVAELIGGNVLKLRLVVKQGLVAGQRRLGVTLGFVQASQRKERLGMVGVQSQHLLQGRLGQL